MGYVLDDGWDNCTPVARAGNAAFGVYVRCGIWVARNLTDGFIPGEIATAYGSPELTRKLVLVGLWEAVEGGYTAVDYLQLNPTAEVVSKRRKADAERKARWREKAAKAKKGGQKPGKQAAQPSPHGTRHGTPPSQDTGQDTGRTLSLAFSSKEEKGDARPAAARAPRASPPNRSPFEDPGEAPPPVDWRTQPAYGTQRDPSDVDRAQLGAATARANIRKPRPTVRPLAGGRAALDAAIADLRQPSEEQQ